MRWSCVAAMGIVLVSGPAHGVVLRVPTQYPTIQSAVDAAAAGDTVRVVPGIYRDCTHPSGEVDSVLACVVMKTGISLLGSGAEQTWIDAGRAGICVYMRDVDRAVVEGFGLSNAGDRADRWSRSPTILARCSNAQIRRCVITPGPEGGIFCAQAPCPILEDCTFRRPERSLQDSSASVSRCALDAAEAGVRLSRSPLLTQRAPDLTNPSTTIVFGLTEPASVTLRIFDVTGREVASLMSCPMVVGTHQLHWDGTMASGDRAAGGTYFYRLTVGDRSWTGRILLSPDDP